MGKREAALEERIRVLAEELVNAHYEINRLKGLHRVLPEPAGAWFAPPQYTFTLPVAC